MKAPLNWSLRGLMALGKKRPPSLRGVSRVQDYCIVLVSVPLADAAGPDNQDNNDDDQHRSDSYHSPQQVGRNNVNRGR